MAPKTPPTRTQTPPSARTTPAKPTTLFTLFVPDSHDDETAGPHFFEDFAHYESAPHTLIAIQEMSDAAEGSDQGPLLVIYDKDADTGRRVATVFLHDDYIDLLMETIAADDGDEEDGESEDEDEHTGMADDDHQDLGEALLVPLNQSKADIGPGVPSAKAKAKGAPKTKPGQTPAETTTPGESTAKATATAPSRNPETSDAPKAVATPKKPAAKRKPAAKK